MLKILPCDTCQSGRATLPGGKPYTIGQPPLGTPYFYKCAGCKRKTLCTTSRYNRLPILTVEMMDELGVLDLVLSDLPGVTKDQLAELARAGVTLAELHPPVGTRGEKDEVAPA